MVLGKFRQRYPQGSLVSKLIDIDRGIYIVRVSVIVDNITLATGLAGRERVEIAEDAARERAIAALMLDSNSNGIATQNSSDSVTKTSNAAGTNSSQTPASTKPASPIAPEHISKPVEQHSENNNVVDFADYPAKKEAQPHATIFNPEEEFKSARQESEVTGSNFEPEARQEVPHESVVKVQEQSAPSLNLFEGTSNVDMMSENNLENNLEDLEGIRTEDSHSNSAPKLESLEEVNFNEIKHKTDLEIKRLGWTKDDGREFLKSRYGKRSRLQLTDSQLLEFLQYLENQPNPN